MSEGLRSMKRAVMVLLICLAGLVFARPVDAVTPSGFEKNYIQRVFDSTTGLEGSAAKTIIDSSEGFLYIGSYTGLFRYDGKQMEKMHFSKEVQSVNALLQDQTGRLWIGTNGDGICLMENRKFQHIQIDENDEYTVSCFAEKGDGIIYAGTNGGLLMIAGGDNEYLVSAVSEFENMEIKKLLMLPDKRLVVIDGDGAAWYYRPGKKEAILPAGFDPEKAAFRCTTEKVDETDEYFYMGTEAEDFYRVYINENKTEKLTCEGLASFNDFDKVEDDCYWICSDNGIGMITGNKVHVFDFPINNSVESACEDYQGNYWFVSSRQGILQLEKNIFYDIGQYLKMGNVTVNSVCVSGDRTYYGTDNGMLCYRGRKLQDQDPLVSACKSSRIRQIYMDRDKRIWVATQYEGIYMETPEGKIVHYDRDNSQLTDNQVRCILQREDGNMLFGTNSGIFTSGASGKDLRRFCPDERLDTERVLCIAEYGGDVFAGMDGRGVFRIHDEKVSRIFTKKDGLFANVVMRIAKSNIKDGIWILCGTGISFLDKDENITPMNEMPVANALDLIIDPGNAAYILAGNGLFVTTEEQMLGKDRPVFTQYTRRSGLPVDFTANARNIIHDHKLYLSGTTGVAALPIGRTDRNIKLKAFVGWVRGDGKEIRPNSRGKYMIPDEVNRISLYVDFINFCANPVEVVYQLSREDKSWTSEPYEEYDAVEYTNLPGGKYTFSIRGMEQGKEDVLGDYSFDFEKTPRFQERLSVRILSTIAVLSIFALLGALFFRRREDVIDRAYQEKLRRATQKEKRRMAYKDTLTGFGNYLLFEKDIHEAKQGDIYAFVSVGINHITYFKYKYSNYVINNVIRETASLIHEVFGTEEIYRIDDYVFAIIIRKKENVEDKIFTLKERFRKQGEEKDRRQSLSVGFVCCGDEEIEYYMEKCAEIRKLDQHIQEEHFIDSRIKKI